MFRAHTTKAIIALGVLIVSYNCNAIEKAQVLPKNVNYLSVRMGIADHLGESFGSGGGIAYRGDNLSQEINMTKIKKFAKDDLKADLEKLVSVLNTFGNSKMADKLSLGTLKFEVDPTVRYTAPIYGRGITERFTLGIAFPIINYKADISIKQVGSNIPQIKKELEAVSSQSEELKKGLDRLDESLVQTFQKTVNERGYKTVQSREDTFLGDIQVVGLYHLIKESRENMILKTGLILPTGPQDDPDDLSDLPNQHQTSIGTGVINDINIYGRWTWGLGAYFLARLPDKVAKRVPMSEDDSLPDSDRKESGLDRDLGDSLTATTNLQYQVNDYFQLAAGYEIGTKSPDQYVGNNDWDYSILSKNTYQSWNKSMFALEYSTVSGFIGGRDPIPFTISYDFSDIFAGTNIERQQVHEVGLRLYF
jgi:hypothetical protein